MKPTHTLATATTSDGAELVLQQHDGSFYLRKRGIALMSTRASASEVELATLACEKIDSEKARGVRVLIGGLGFGFSLRRVLELVPESARVEVAELIPEIVEWNRTHLREVNGQQLDDARVAVEQRDVFDLIVNATRSDAARYDAILLDVDNSPDPFVQEENARLYAHGGLVLIQRALKQQGRVVFWSANQDQSFEQDLKQIFARTRSVRAKAYPQAKRFTHTLFVADCR